MINSGYEKQWKGSDPYGSTSELPCELHCELHCELPDDSSSQPRALKAFHPPPSRDILMQAEMDAVAEEQMISSPPNTPSAVAAASLGLLRSSSLHTDPSMGGVVLSPFERVRLKMVPEMVTTVQMLGASVCDSWVRKNLQTEEDVRQVSRQPGWAMQESALWTKLPGRCFPGLRMYHRGSA